MKALLIGGEYDGVVLEIKEHREAILQPKRVRVPTYIDSHPALMRWENELYRRVTFVFGGRRFTLYVGGGLDDDEIICSLRRVTNIQGWLLIERLIYEYEDERKRRHVCLGGYAVALRCVRDCPWKHRGIPLPHTEQTRPKHRRGRHAR